MGENEWTSKNWHFIHQTLLLDEINIVWDQTLWSYWPLLHQSFTSLLCDLVYFLRQNASEPGLSNSLQPSIFFFIKFSRGIILSQNSTGLALYHCPAGKTILKVWSWLSGPQKVRLKPQKKKKNYFPWKIDFDFKSSCVSEYFTGKRPEAISHPQLSNICHLSSHFLCQKSLVINQIFQSSSSLFLMPKERRGIFFKSEVYFGKKLR